MDLSVLADRGVRAAAGLDPRDTLGGKRAGAHEIFGVPLGVDVVGDGGDLVAGAQRLAQRVHQRGLARADRAADADAEGAVGIGHDWSQLLNSRVYWVSCRMLARSARKLAAPTSSRAVTSARAAVARTTGSSAAKMRCPSVCPSGTSRTPADTRLTASACR